MSEVGLPPVGELVQITYDGRTDSSRSCLAILDEYGWFVPVLSPGPYIEAVCVTAWCRVLVLPDKDEAEAIERLAGSFYDASPGRTWAALTDEDRRFYLALNGHGFRAVLAALREAAIR